MKLLVFLVFIGTLIPADEFLITKSFTCEKMLTQVICKLYYRKSLASCVKRQATFTREKACIEENCIEMWPECIQVSKTINASDALYAKKEITLSVVYKV